MPPMYGILGGMEKTTVYLTTEQKRALEWAARAAGRSEARLIREGIEAVTAPGRIAETAAALVSGPPRGPDFASPAPARRPRWMPRDELVRLLGEPADPGLRAELRRLAPDMIGDEMIP